MRVDQIKQKSGWAGEIGGRAVAVYRDTEDIYVFENTCPHLHCPLAWNETDHVWGCPCHNSRFDPKGGLLNGPAREGLRRLAATVDNGEIGVVDGKD